MFSWLVQKIRQVIHKMIPYKSIEAAENIDSPLSVDMINALDKWYKMYLNKAPWLKDGKVKSTNIAAFVCSEIARQVCLEMKWNITGVGESSDGEVATNPRAEYLSAEFKKLVDILRQKLEQGCAAGGMAIKPYAKDGHIHFDWTMNWSMYPIAFGDDGDLADVIFPDSFTDGKTYYTRLERHTVKGDKIHITQRAFKSSTADSLGREIPLTEVERWAGLAPEADLNDTGGQMFGWFKVAQANNVDVESPLGASVFSKAVDEIRDADEQYSRLNWEFEGSELAIDVDPTALRPKKDGYGVEMPRLNDRLFRGVDLGNGDNYSVFSPNIRDVSIINGLNTILKRVEDLCGLARGTLSDPDTDARTATELDIVKQRTYSTISDNQKALENCLRDVIRVMDKYATIYKLAPEGKYEVSFEWDDSIVTDMQQEMTDRSMLLNMGAMALYEIRMWYFGETEEQAKKKVAEIAAEKASLMMDIQSLLPKVPAGGDADTGNPAAV